jgi:hypothetical protein
LVQACSQPNLAARVVVVKSGDRAYALRPAARVRLFPERYAFLLVD